jgi:hypothetical protein
MGTWRGGREARNARIQRVLCEGEDSRSDRWNRSALLSCVAGIGRASIG